MNLEIEKKYRLPRERRIQVEDSMKELGGEFVRDDVEENTIYGGGDLERTASIVRIRRTQERSVLTYKRRLENLSDVKQQIEYEPRIVYEKRRAIWKLRSVEVLLDELPFGLFMEIEGSLTQIKEAEMLIGIEDLETEHETYPRLTAQLGKKTGTVIEARFD
jgi:adenylate cyclase class IV